jgi:hypothetical protein
VTQLFVANFSDVLPSLRFVNVIGTAQLLQIALINKSNHQLGLIIGGQLIFKRADVGFCADNKLPGGTYNITNSSALLLVG